MYNSENFKFNIAEYPSVYCIYMYLSIYYGHRNPIHYL